MTAVVPIDLGPTHLTLKFHHGSLQRYPMTHIEQKILRSRSTRIKAELVDVGELLSPTVIITFRFAATPRAHEEFAFESNPLALLPR